MNKKIKVVALTPEWKLVTAFALAAGIALVGTHTALSLGRAGMLLAVIPLFAGTTVIYRYLRPAPRLADLLSTTLKLFLILTFGMLISFAAGALSGPFPFRDLWLQSADAALGFDWAAYVAFISRYSLLAAALKLAYASLQPQFFLVGAVVALAGQRERLTIYTRAIGVTLAVTLVIFIFMPARAHGAGTWITALDYMRSAGPHAISFDDMNGIITFPSFHTQSACLFIWACWRMPYLRWPVLILNLALIAATPVDGVHYGVDVLAGVLIAVATIFLLSPKDTKAAIDIVSTNIGEAIGGTPVSARSVPID